MGSPNKLIKGESQIPKGRVFTKLKKSQLRGFNPHKGKFQIIVDPARVS